MNIDMWITLILLVSAIALFVTEWLRVDIVAFGVVVALMITGILSTDEALAGFSNSAVLTIAALFIVGGATMQTGLAAQIGRSILKVGGTNPIRLNLVLMVSVAFMSSFLSDTGTVALLLPAALVLANDAKISPSKLLIPLSYGSLLGGAITLIGTTPNLIVSQMLAENGYQPFGFFAFTPLGLIMLVTGILFMVPFGRKLLPDRSSLIESQPVQNPSELLDLYRLPGNLYHVRVRRTSPLVGLPLANARFREVYDINVLDIRRPLVPLRDRSLGTILNGEWPDTVETTTIHPAPDTIIQVDDILIVQGGIRRVTRASNRLNLGVRPVGESEDNMLINKEIGIAEILLPPRSSVAGKSVVDLHFGSRNRLNVLGIQRPGSSEPMDIKNTKLRFGDILLVQGAWEDILALRKHSGSFVVLGQPEACMGAPRSAKANYALAVMAIMLLLMITNVVSVTTASLLAALLMVLTGCLTMDDAYRSIDWKSIILIAGMLPMSTALQKTGLIDLAANAFTEQLGTLGPLAVLAALFLVTSLFTQVLSNTATAVLIAPIALAAANTLGLEPQAFLMAVAVAASMAFASPVASPVNTLVMGAGSYRFSDYLKAGLPMIFLMLVVSILALPVLFPF